VVCDERPRELTCHERHIVWTDVILREDPGIGRFPTQANRTIPVAVIESSDHQPGLQCRHPVSPGTE